MKTETHTMPAHWASAVINCDMSGLSQPEKVEYFSYFQSNPEYNNPVSCSEETTLERFTFYPANTMLVECLEYTFLRG